MIFYSLFIFLLGDVLVFVNEKNLLQSPISLTHDRIKSELTSLRRQKKSIRIGVCRCSDRSLFNHKTIRHLGSLTIDEFEKISLEITLPSSLNESQKSLNNTDEIISNTDGKKTFKDDRHNKLLLQKRSTSPTRDSGYIETDGTNTSMVTDRSVISNHRKRRSKSSLEKSEDESLDTHKSLESLQQSISKPIAGANKPSGLIYDRHRRVQRDAPTQTVTDACFIYRRQTVKHETSEDEKAALIHRGREIAHEAANAPILPSSMPTYTRDQIRELYGELDQKTRRLQEDEYSLHSSIKNFYPEKPQWKLASPTNSKISDQCPLPKFRLEPTPENNETLLMAAYLSAGLTNSQAKPLVPVDNFHTVMMNASAKVNEWANNNEIYLTPTEKDTSTSVNSSPLLRDVHLNLKKLAGTPTGNNDRPTFLESIEQERLNPSNQTLSNRENRRSIRRQDHMTDTTSSSPDSMDIVFDTTPSTPGSCGMYLEPYMRHGYDLPCIDHYIRDSSWQHTDNDDAEESMKNIPPMESSIRTSKLETNILPSPPVVSQIIDTDSLIDLDDGTTNSYHTAKESRLDNGRQSTISIASDETTTSTLHQPMIRDELGNPILSPEDSFYYDALASPSQANQQITTAIDKQNLLIDNLANLLEQIESFTLKHYSLSKNLYEEKSSRSSPKGEQSNNDIDQLTTIVNDIYQFNQPTSNNTMDNLLFIYDDIPDEQVFPSNDNLVQIDQTNNPTSTCMDNLLFIYDDTVTPTETEAKSFVNVSDEWSYDNLNTEQVDTDHIGTIVHDILAARFPKPIKFKHTDETERENPIAMIPPPLNDDEEEPTVSTDNLGTIVHEALAARFQKPIRFKHTDEIKREDPTVTIQPPMNDDKEESPVDTDNLGTIVHEALAARFQKRIIFKPTEEVKQEEEPVATVQQPVTDGEEESAVSTDNLGTIVHEALAARFQRPIRFKHTDEIKREDPIVTIQPPVNDDKEESPVNTDNLGTIVYEALAARFQKRIIFKPTEEVKQEEDPIVPVQQPVNDEEKESVVDTDNLGTVVHEALAGRFQKPIEMKTTDPLVTEVHTGEFVESINEPTVEIDNLGMIIHDALATRFQKPIKTKKTDLWLPDVHTKESTDLIDNAIPDTNNLSIIVHEALAAGFQKPIVTFDQNVSADKSPEFIDESINNQSLDQETVPSIYEQPIDESADHIHRSETIIYEIESLRPQVDSPVSEFEAPPPVSNLSQIVSDSLLTSSNYHRHHRDENKIEVNITHQSPIYDEEIYEEYGYRRTTTDPDTEDIVEKFEELYHRYSSNIDQYEKTTKKLDDEINQFEKQVHEQKEQVLTPTSDTVSEELITTIERLVDRSDEKDNETEETYQTLIVKRQPYELGKYGFNFDESLDGKIQISSIIDENYCPNLHLGDEIISINNNRTFKTSDQCQLILDSLWKNFYEDVQITILQSANIPNLPSK